MDDYRILWWEALVMVLYYCLIYVPMLGKWESIKAFLLRCVSGRYQGAGADAMLDDEEPNPLAISYKTGSSKIVDIARSQRRANSEAQVTSAFEGLSGHLAKSLSHSIAASKRVTYGITDMAREAQSGEALRHFAQAQQMEVELQPVALRPPGDAPLAGGASMRGRGLSLGGLPPGMPTLDMPRREMQNAL